MKIITWNVAGFRRSNSLDTWDYSDVDVKYFADAISSYNPDVILLQEVEFVDGVDRVKELSELLNIKNFESFPMHPNHISEGMLGYAVLSKDNITEISSTNQPYPEFDLTFADGKSATRFDKKLITFKSFGISFTTLQLQPLHYWGYNYYEEPGYSYSKSISESLLNINSDIITGDFQFSHLEVPFKDLFSTYKDILPDEFTRLRKNGKHTKSDHILTKMNFKTKDTQVMKTQTDHFLCFAEFEI